MRAVTLTQPWCGLMAAGLKPIENRGRKIIAPSSAGQQMALHASREVDADVYASIANIAPELRNPSERTVVDARLPWWKLSRITSAVIAVGTLVTCIERTDHGWRISDGWPAVVTLAPDDLRWFFGAFGYVLRDVDALERPVPCRGWQGFWTLPADVDAAVRAQLPITATEVADALAVGADERAAAERIRRPR